MSKRLFLALAVLALAVFPACKKDSKPAAQESDPASAKAAAGAPQGAAASAAMPGHGANMAASAGAGSTRGKVLETMSSGGYTYVQVDTGAEKVWAAAPETTVKVGDTVSFGAGQAMPGFHSKTLDRTFDNILFVNAIAVGDAPSGAGATASMGGAHPAPSAPAAVDLSGIEKAKGGHTVGELFAKRSELSGKQVSVRGKVVKVNLGIMGKNWIHIQDGTGDTGANDLVVTTAPAVKVDVGNTVLVKGTASTDKDFGAGYKYDLIIEDATAAVE